MKKIMFNDKYGLTNAVLEGRKSTTRRTVTLNLYNQTDWKAVSEGDYEAVVDSEGDYHDIRDCGRYKVGEVVAIAQSYFDLPVQFVEELGKSGINLNVQKDGTLKGIVELPGWNNKMFVRADLMPHHIRITNIKVERLQDISDDDCMKEGIYEDAEEHGGLYTTPFYDFHGNTDNGFYEPREAFAALIDKVSGKDTWDKNPWVFVYEFEKID